MRKMAIVTLVVVALIVMALVGRNYIRSQIVDGPGMERDTTGCRFEYQLIKADGNNYGSIVVKGYKDDKAVFECSHELVANVGVETAADHKWINSDVDINFDGISDLQIFLWYETRGQVAERYAAYVWTNTNQYEEVKQWEDLCNPKIDPESKTITESYRSDINERTTNTYKWKDEKTLELINTQKGKFFED